MKALETGGYPVIALMMAMGSGTNVGNLLAVRRRAKR
ncbi:MAG: hypothetical protein JWR19_2673 [Pedosphaera sp.]|nr:hypothetical protein [Pedosphaera sp.]